MSDAGASNYFRPRDVSKALDVKYDVVLEFIRRGDLKAINVATNPHGRPRWRIPETSIQTFAAARSAQTEPPMKRIRRRRDPAVKEFF